MPNTGETTSASGRRLALVRGALRGEVAGSISSGSSTGPSTLFPGARGRRIGVPWTRSRSTRHRIVTSRRARARGLRARPSHACRFAPIDEPACCCPLRRTSSGKTHGRVPRPGIASLREHTRLLVEHLHRSPLPPGLLAVDASASASVATVHLRREDPASSGSTVTPRRGRAQYKKRMDDLAPPPPPPSPPATWATEHSRRRYFACRCVFYDLVRAAERDSAPRAQL